MLLIVMYILIIGYEVQQLLPVHQLMISLFWSVMARVKEVIVSFLSFLYCVKSSGLVTKYVNKVLLGFHL